MKRAWLAGATGMLALVASVVLMARYAPEAAPRSPHNIMLFTSHVVRTNLSRP
jgi:hypothetical protein